jgi:hypothetical protein
MAYFSGYEASRAHSGDLPPELVTQCINEGLGVGFDLGVWGRNRGPYDHGMDLMYRLVRNPHGARIVGAVTSSLVAVAIFVFGAPPMILLPAILISGTAFIELRSRAIGRFGGR